MIKYLNLLRSVFVMVVLAVMMVAPQSAHAQSQPTWLPDFSVDRHVHVDPLLSGHRTAPVNLSGLESTLIQEGQRHGLQIYLVATQEGSDIVRGNVPSRDVLDKLINKWQSRPGFPADNYLIIVWVRYVDNPTKGSIAVNGGNWFSDWNMTGQHFSDPNGPVTPNVRRFMPHDPKGAFVAVVQAINGEIDVIKAQEAERAKQEAFQQMLPFYIGGGALVLIILGTLLWLILRFSSAKKRSAKLIADWKKDLDSSNELYLKLRKSYMGFLTEQVGWRGTFKNRTLREYTAACKNFAKFSARQKRANELFKAAEKAFAAHKWPSVAGFKEVQALLAERIVTITGEDLPLEEAKLFEGLVEKTDYKPGELLKAMSELFDLTNKALAGIVKAMEGARKNKEDIEQLDAAVNGKRKPIEEAGLTFEPYEARLAELKEGQAGFIAILVTDPLEAFDGSESVETGFTALEQRLGDAITFKQSLPDVKTKIDTSENKASEQRKQPATYAYPLAEGETRPKELVAPRFLLAEEGSNPDTVVAAAREQLASAHTLVYQGKLEDAAQAKAEAIRLAKRTSDLVDDIVAAKLFVEENVPTARTTLASLTAELPDADAAVVELNRDFLAANVGKQPVKVTTGHTVETNTPTHLAGIKEHYDNQRYVAARALARSTQSSLNSARTGLSEVHAHLKELRRLRKDSRDTVATISGTAQRLETKLRDNAFTTSEATDTAFKTAQRNLATQKGECDKNIADWPTVNAEVHKLKTSFDGFDQQIDTQAAQYRTAKTDVTELDTAIGEAESFVNNDATTDATRNALRAADTTHGELSRQIRVAKSNWANISQRANEATSQANGAKQSAQTEIRTCSEANTAYSNASEKIRVVSRKEYGYDVEANLSDANEKLRQSADAFRSKSYATAKTRADEAYAAAESADTSAQRRAKKKHDDAVQAAADAAAAALAKATQGNSGGGTTHRTGGGTASGGTRDRDPDPGPRHSPPPPQIRGDSGGTQYKGRSGGTDY